MSGNLCPDINSILPSKTVFFALSLTKPYTLILGLFVKKDPITPKALSNLCKHWLLWLNYKQWL
jgi:hypothetical protein